MAIEDYFYDGPQKSMKFAPKITKDSFRGFFTAAEGWGNIEQTIKSGVQTNLVIVRYGKVRLKSLSVETEGKIGSVKVYLGNSQVPSTYFLKNNSLCAEFGDVTITPDKPLRLEVLKPE